MTTHFPGLVQAHPLTVAGLNSFMDQNIPLVKLCFENYITVRSSTTLSIYKYDFSEIKILYIFALSGMLYLINCFVFLF